MISTRRIVLFVLFFVIAYAVSAWAAEGGAPRGNDWWDLIYAVAGAIVGWLTRFLQNRAR